MKNETAVQFMHWNARLHSRAGLVWGALRLSLVLTLGSESKTRIGKVVFS